MSFRSEAFPSIKASLDRTVTKVPKLDVADMKTIDASLNEMGKQSDRGVQISEGVEKIQVGSKEEAVKRISELMRQLDLEKTAANDALDDVSEELETAKIVRAAMTDLGSAFDDMASRVAVMQQMDELVYAKRRLQEMLDASNDVRKVVLPMMGNLKGIDNLEKVSQVLGRGARATEDLRRRAQEARQVFLGASALLQGAERSVRQALLQHAESVGSQVFMKESFDPGTIGMRAAALEAYQQKHPQVRMEFSSRPPREVKPRDPALAQTEANPAVNKAELLQRQRVEDLEQDLVDIESSALRALSVSQELPDQSYFKKFMEISRALSDLRFELEDHPDRVETLLTERDVIDQKMGALEAEIQEALIQEVARVGEATFEEQLKSNVGLDKRNIAARFQALEEYRARAKRKALVPFVRKNMLTNAADQIRSFFQSF